MRESWKPSRRQFLGALGAGVAGSATIGCYPSAPMPPLPLPPPEMTDDTSLRLLNRITFGPKTEDIARINELGYDGFLEEQLHPDTIEDNDAEARIAPLGSLGQDAAGLQFYLANIVKFELQAAAIVRAVYSKRQLFERMVEFWTDHFNIYHEVNGVRYLKTIDDREVIRRHALGNFKDMLLASAKSPAMLVYLNNDTNVTGHPNENYSREAMELHTVGVNGGYTQKDVEELARALTGWSVDRSGGQRGTFIYRPEDHDDGSKQIMDLSLPAGGGISDGEQALAYLADHPNTATFLATKLVRHFVAESAPSALVAEVAAAFRNSGGDIKSTLKALFAESAIAQAEFKFKRPFHLYVDAARRSGAHLNIVGRMIRPLRDMGHEPFQWPAPNGYPDVAGFWSPGLLNRWNLGTELARGRVTGIQVDPQELAEINEVATPREVIALWDQMFFASELPQPERDALIDYINEDPEDRQRLFNESFALALSSPSFQWH